MLDIKIFSSPLNPDAALAAVSSPAAGGIVSFVGTVRDNTKGRAVQYLDFEAYEPMAIKEMTKIAQAVEKKWAALHVVMHHRVGKVEIGGIAVIINIATAHRKAAFEACEYAIDRLKETVPIWKKEVFEDGEIWVSAHP